MILGIYTINVAQKKIKSMNLREQGLHGRKMEEIVRGNYLIFLKLKKNVKIFLQLSLKNLIEHQ